MAIPDQAPVLVTGSSANSFQLLFLTPPPTVSLETGHLKTNIEDFMLNMRQLCFECSIVFI